MGEHDEHDEQPQAALTDGTVAEVMDKVGGDVALAQLAYAEESAKGDKARSTLLAELSAVLHVDPETGEAEVGPEVFAAVADEPPGVDPGTVGPEVYTVTE